MADKPKKVKEDRQVTLRRLASKRVPRALSSLRLVGNLGKYGPTRPQAEAIVGVLAEMLKAVQSALSSPTAAPKSEFKLP